jgi:hypothetical protein
MWSYCVPATDALFTCFSCISPSLMQHALKLIYSSQTVNDLRTESREKLLFLHQPLVMSDKRKQGWTGACNSNPTNVIITCDEHIHHKRSKQEHYIKRRALYGPGEIYTVHKCYNVRHTIVIIAKDVVLHTMEIEDVHHCKICIRPEYEKRQVVHRSAEKFKC